MYRYAKKAKIIKKTADPTPDIDPYRPETVEERQERRIREEAGKLKLMKWVRQMEAEVYEDVNPPKKVTMEDWNDTSKLDRELYAMMQCMKLEESRQAESEKKIEEEPEEPPLPAPVDGIIALHGFPWVVDPDYFRPRKVIRYPKNY